MTLPPTQPMTDPAPYLFYIWPCTLPVLFMYDPAPYLFLCKTLHPTCSIYMTLHTTFYIILYSYMTLHHACSIYDTAVPAPCLFYAWPCTPLYSKHDHAWPCLTQFNTASPFLTLLDSARPCLTLLDPAGPNLTQLDPVWLWFGNRRRQLNQLTPQSGQLIQIFWI